MAELPSGCIVIGVGNPDRGDDGAGPAVARQLREAALSEAEIVEHDGEVASLLGRLYRVAAAYLIDACASGAQPGNIRRFDIGAESLPHDVAATSTHGLGLVEAMALARVLDQLPPRCIVYAIEGVSFERGAPLSSPVAAAVHEVANRLRTEISGADAQGKRSDA